MQSKHFLVYCKSIPLATLLLHKFTFSQLLAARKEVQISMIVGSDLAGPTIPKSLNEEVFGSVYKFLVKGYFDRLY